MAKTKKATKKKVQKRKKPIVETSFFAGFIGAKAAGSTDEEALMIATLFDDEE